MSVFRSSFLIFSSTLIAAFKDLFCSGNEIELSLCLGYKYESSIKLQSLMNVLILYVKEDLLYYLKLNEILL